MTTEPTTSFEPGTLVHDPVTDRIGEYRAASGPYAMLRPVGGGREWQADPGSLRAATPEQRLSAGVRAANERAERATWGYPSRADRPRRCPAARRAPKWTGCGGPRARSRTPAR